MSILESLISEDFTITNTQGRFVRTIEHDSLVLDREKDIFYWNSRGVFGNALTYLTKIRGLSHRNAKEFLDTNNAYVILPTVVDVPEKATVSSELVDIFYKKGFFCRDYWYNKRGYTEKTVNDFKLGYTGEWYTIPIFVDGVFKNFQLRKEFPKTVRYWYTGSSPLPFNFSILKLTSWVVLTEGPVDAIMLRQNNIPAISQTGGSSHWNNSWNSSLLHLNRIFIVYDNDPAGKDNSKKLATLWGSKAKIYTFDKFDPKFDITDYFKSGKTRENFIQLLEKESRYEWEV